jgi:hypothetical protein
MSRPLGSLKLTDVVLLTGDAGGGLTDTDDLPEGSTNLYYTNARVAAYLTSLTGTDDTSTFLRGDNAWSNTLIGDLGLQPPASGARNLTFTYPGDAQPIGLLTVTRGATADLDVVKVGRERRDTALYSSYLQFSDRAIFHAESPTIICNLQVDPTVGLGRVFVDANLLDASNANFGGGVNVGTATGAATGQVKASASVLSVQPCARVSHNAAQSITTSGVPQFVAFNTEHYDTDTIHDTATNNTRLTCKTAGKYRIFAHVEWAASATGERQIELLVGGATVIAAVLHAASPAAPTKQAVSTTYGLAVNDYVELRAYQTSGGALNINSGNYYTPVFGMEYVSN